MLPVIKIQVKKHDGQSRNHGEKSYSSLHVESFEEQKHGQKKESSENYATLHFNPPFQAI
jgi:hypothetical protein